MSNHWTLDDIDWFAFDTAKVAPDLLPAVKAAAMVEFNAGDYVTYLCNIFDDEPELKELIRVWGDEEIQHGRALAKWAAMADPDFDFDAGIARFRAGYSLPLDATESVRGSRAGELLARCVVETGTSSFYTALKESSEEPVLRQIAERIAADEFRHYRLFYECFEKIGHELPSKWRRFKIALGRVNEADDDELSYAYYCGNVDPRSATPYVREDCSRAYKKRAFSVYRRRHTDRIVSMLGKPVGFDTGGWLTRALKTIVWWVFSAQVRRLKSAA